MESFFKVHGADIICLQEHKISDHRKLTADIAVVEGYDSFFSFSGKGYAGVATFARKGSVRWWTDNPFSVPLNAPSQSRDVGKLDPDTDPDVSIGRCVMTDHVEFLLLNIYAPNAGRGEQYLKRKMEFYETLANCVRKWQDAGRKVIVTGDINTAHSELDIYNPSKFHTTTGFLDSERDWITRTLEDNEMRDVFRFLYPEVRKYSFWDQKRMQRAPNNGWRIDVYYCSNDLVTPTAESEILNDVTGSDHCPITLLLPDIKLPKDLTCKDASSNRESVNPRKLDGFFSKSVKGQGIKRPIESDDEKETGKKGKIEG